MIEATERAGVIMIVGHSHSFDRPILRTREIVQSGAVGAVRMISAQNYTDYLYRPRRPEELATEVAAPHVQLPPVRVQLEVHAPSLCALRKPPLKHGARV